MLPAQSIFNTPAQFIEPLVDRVIRQANKLGPGGHRKRAATVSYAPRPTRVPVLHFCCSPDAVGGAVVFIIVKAFNAVSRAWFSPHVVQKRHIHPPSRGDAYASTAIARVRTGMRVVAPRVHTLPRVVFRATRVSMRNALRPRTVFFKAATGLSVPRGEVTLLGLHRGPTRTAAPPENGAGRRSADRSVRDQPAVNLARNVFGVRVQRDKGSIVHGNSCRWVLCEYNIGWPLNA